MFLIDDDGNDSDSDDTDDVDEDDSVNLGMLEIPKNVRAWPGRTSCLLLLIPFQ